MSLGQKTSGLIINRRFGEIVELIKKSVGLYIDGIYSPGSETITNVTVHYQPATDDDRLNLPEGERIKEALRVWVKTNDRNLIRPMRQGPNNTPGDVFRIKNINYEVYHVDDFSTDEHILALCMRQENQDG